MPEGDTIHRAARALDRALAGRPVTAFRSPLPRLAAADLVGRRVARVEAKGKNLLIRFEDGRVLRSHMRMTGSWHLYRRGERWRKPERLARAVVETPDLVAVCFSAPVVELLSPRAVSLHRTLARLGPDVLAGELDAPEILRRLRARPRLAIGEALLDQSALSGVGNIYKSESLFLAGVSPFAAVGALSDAEIERVLARAREQMRRSLRGAPRATRPGLDGGRYWVYRRAGLPCLRCGAAIEMRRQGEAARSTYFCPRCQTVGRRETADGSRNGLGSADS